MTTAQNRELIDIIRHYGFEKQIDVAIEEMSELAQALLKDRRNSTKESISNIIDELADVTVMISQLMIIFDCEGEVEERATYKINRQINRMKEGK